MKISEDQIHELLELIGEQGKSLREACQTVGVKRSTASDTLLSGVWRGHYARAKDDRAELWFEEIRKIAEEKAGVIVDEDGNERLDSGFQQRQKTRIDAIKWMLARMDARKYGDRIEQNVTSKSEVTNKLDLSKVPDEILKKLLDTQGSDESE